MPKLKKTRYEEVRDRFIATIYKYKQYTRWKDIARKIMMDESTLSRKIHRKSDFTLNEIFTIVEKMRFTEDDINYIFCK